MTKCDCIFYDLHINIMVLLKLKYASFHLQDFIYQDIRTLLYKTFFVTEDLEYSGLC